MGRRTGAARKFPDISAADRMETKEYFEKTPEAVNDPWSKENVNKNREMYIKNPLKFLERFEQK